MTTTQVRAPFPTDGLCTCGSRVRYCEQVPSVRAVSIYDGIVYVSDTSEEITEAATDHVFECETCLTEYDDPQGGYEF